MRLARTRSGGGGFFSSSVLEIKRWCIFAPRRGRKLKSRKQPRFTTTSWPCNNLYIAIETTINKFLQIYIPRYVIMHIPKVYRNKAIHISDFTANLQ